MLEVSTWPHFQIPSFLHSTYSVPLLYSSRSLLGNKARHSTLEQLEEYGRLFDHTSRQAGLHWSDGTWYACSLAAGVHRNILGLGHSPPLVVYVLLGYHGLSMLKGLDLGRLTYWYRWNRLEQGLASARCNCTKTRAKNDDNGKLTRVSARRSKPVSTRLDGEDTGEKLNNICGRNKTWLLGGIIPELTRSTGRFIRQSRLRTHILIRACTG
jgi:hypothetical protein